MILKMKFILEIRKICQRDLHAKKYGSITPIINYYPLENNKN